MLNSQNNEYLRDGYTGLDSRSFVVHLPSHLMVPGAFSNRIDYPDVTLSPHRHIV
jgi:hypothetical protein